MFSRSEVEKQIDQGQTVMIDFTADWCQNCKFNERFAFNTLQTLEVVKNNSVVVVKADMTHDDELTDEINQFLVDLGHSDKSIPYMVIFPANGSAPVAFSGPVARSTVVKALKDAGPSRSVGPEVAQAE